MKLNRQKARLSAHRLRRNAHLLGKLLNDTRFSVFATEGGPIRQFYVVADDRDKTTVGKLAPLAHFHATPDAMFMQEKIWKPELFSCSLSSLEVKNACRHFLSNNPSHNNLAHKWTTHINGKPVDDKDLLSEALAKVDTMNIVEFMDLLVECGVKKEDLVYKHTAKNEQLHDSASKWVEDIIGYLSPLIDEQVDESRDDLSKRLTVIDELYKHSSRPDDIAAKLAVKCGSMNKKINYPMKRL